MCYSDRERKLAAHASVHCPYRENLPLLVCGVSRAVEEQEGIMYMSVKGRAFYPTEQIDRE